ncbi:MAG: glycoside hydrolase family 3 C-terminal domain-containing protein [Clostridia bacterium]|nr:glycoside hydrolase family 3 C-terminal domain-containing protein [Clostridia bacterium]
MNAKEILSQMTLEEKAAILTGAESMLTTGVPRLGIPGKNLADGPHGVRSYVPGTNCTTLPSMCAIGATWSREAAELAGKTMGIDCIHHNKQMILGPGLNIKRNALGGRNFEYVSEDPILTGEIAGHVTKGIEDLGIGTSMKHFALNSSETYRTETSVEIDERTMREIYLRGFEKAIKIGNPTSLMCAYNKIHSLWCSENYNLLTEILRHDWGYQGLVVSDWGAVHHGAKAVKAGLDLRMPGNPDTIRDVKEAIANGTMTMDELDTAAERVLHFLLKPVPQEEFYDRDAQHEAARNVAREAICLLRNDRDLLPITQKKYKKICVTGEYAVMPYINGQGSAEVFTEPEYVDTPLDCLRRMLPDTQIDYFDYLPRKKPDKMLWHYFREKMPNIESYDLVLVFTGVAPSDDSEQFDRAGNQLAGYIEDVMRNVVFHNPNCCLILCSGCSTFKSPKADLFPAIVQMWPTGEGAGQAIADVLTGAVNPSGKLSETFPTKMRTDLDLYGNGLVQEYTEKWRVGYRYYDLHPEEIWFPFGHGLHYTTFDYQNAAAVKNDKGWALSFDLTNTGDMDGAEVVQLYVGDPASTMTKPVKELKQFEKVFLKAGETKKVTFQITDEDLNYYNVATHQWMVENGVYDLYLCASSRDIRAKVSIEYNDPNSYSMQVLDAMIG